MAAVARRRLLLCGFHSRSSRPSSSAHSLAASPSLSLRCVVPLLFRSSAAFWSGFGTACSPGLFRDDYACRRWEDGGFELAAAQAQCRGYAAKSKKAKRTEVVPESPEDIASTAKETALTMMENALDVLSREHSKLRTGRASAGMLDHITVEAHGVRTPLCHIAAVTVSGLQMLSVVPYDGSMVKEVEKSILNSPLGLNPQVEGATLMVPLPRGL